MSRQIHEFACLLVGHDMEYTDEYAHPDGYAVAESVCERCHYREVAWVGPNLEDFPDGIEHPTRAEAYDDGQAPIDLPARYD